MKSRIRVAALVVAAGAVAIIALVNITADTPAPLGLGEFALPAVGAIEPRLLHDGHPVFVSHDLEGTISVIDGISTHNVADWMGWCPSSRTIEDIFHGARWDAQGRYMAGPGPSNLGLYEYEVAADDESLVVTEYLGTSPRTQSPTGPTGPPCEDGEYEVHPYHDAN
jgi:hypothetical protein